GLAAQASRNTTVHCIDLFPELADWSRNADGTYSYEVMLDGTRYRGCDHQTVWSDVFDREIRPVYDRHGSIRAAFDARMKASGLSSIVRPFRGNLERFVRKLRSGEIRCRLAFIDGEHSYEAVAADIRHVEPLLVSGAWLCFDDAFSGYTGVDRAIEELVI